MNRTTRAMLTTLLAGTFFLNAPRPAQSATAKDAAQPVVPPRLNERLLFLIQAGDGGGRLLANPGGLPCDFDHCISYPYGARVTLTAEPYAGSGFDGWSGSGCSGTGSCMVIMETSQVVTGTFSLLGPTDSLDFYSVAPCRVLDTRSGGQALISGVKRIVQITGLCSIPADAVAVSFNLTAISPSSNGWITLYPGNDSLQLVSSVNFSSGMIRTNNAILFLATDASGTLAAQALLEGGGQVDLVLDVNGFFR